MSIDALATAQPAALPQLYTQNFSLLHHVRLLIWVPGDAVLDPIGIQRIKWRPGAICRLTWSQALEEVDVVCGYSYRCGLMSW